MLRGKRSPNLAEQLRSIPSSSSSFQLKPLQNTHSSSAEGVKQLRLFHIQVEKADIIPCTTADQEKCMESTGSKAAHLLEAEQGTSGWCHRKFVTNTGGGTEPPTAYKGHSSAAHTPPKLGRGTWLFISACFLIFRSVWENYICDPSTERTPNLSPDAKL